MELYNSFLGNSPHWYKKNDFSLFSAQSIFAFDHRTHSYRLAHYWSIYIDFGHGP